jgi:hypothetical protein
MKSPTVTHHEVIHDLHSLTRNENEELVMPAWMAGIQDPRMRPETSVSPWIPALHAGMTQSRDLLELTGTHPASHFSKGSRINFAFFESFVVNNSR